jgi:molybdate transport system substrate-binding protein
MRSRLLIPAMVLAGVLAACSSGTSGSTGPGATSTSSRAPAAAGSATAGPGSTAVNLTILGAASLKGALEKAKAAYEAANPGVTLTVSTDSSAALATQIQQGAPADVFLSADMSNPKKLVDGGFASGAPVVFAGNGLTVIVPKGNPGGVATPADLAKPGLKIIAAGDAVPITKYASQLVSNLAALPGYPAGFAGAYAANVASKEDNVKAIVAKVELGEGEAGIVYVTDAAASSKVATVAVPDAANVPASYSGVVVKASARADAARAFLDWLAGPDGQAVLAGFGFLPPPR